MKTRIKLIALITFVITMTYVMNTYGQEYELKGDTYQKIEQVDSTTKAHKTGLKVLEKDGKKYDLWQGPKGGYFIIRTSKKTGKPYKKYIKLD